MSTKVNNPVTIDTTDGKKLCVKGKLVLIRNVVSATVHVKPDGKGYVPYIISETEEYDKGDNVLHLNHGIHMNVPGRIKGPGWNKILVLPEQFYISTIMRIEEGSFKDGDNIWVEVRPDRAEGTTHYAMGSFNWEVAINDVNKVSLYDLQSKMYTHKELETIFDNLITELTKEYRKYEAKEENMVCYGKSLAYADAAHRLIEIKKTFKE